MIVHLFPGRESKLKRIETIGDKRYLRASYRILKNNFLTTTSNEKYKKIIQNLDPNLSNLYLGINFKQMFSTHWEKESIKPTDGYKSVFEYGELII